MIATEGWVANLPIARAALTPLGVDVVHYDADTDPSMPFPDGSFDVIVDRHESYDAGEISRTLTPGGVFVTQQVAGNNDAELYDWFGHQPQWPDVTLANHRATLEAAGLTIEHAEDWAGRAVFTDIGALVYYLVNVPWEAPPDFTAAHYRHILLGLHHTTTPLAITARRFIVVGRRPRR